MRRFDLLRGQLGLAGFLVLFTGGCCLFKGKTTPGEVAVNCHNLEKFQSSFGVLNAPEFQLGDVIALNPLNKQAQRVYTASPNPDELGSTDPIDDTSIVTESTFTFEFSANIPQTVQASLKTLISENTLFQLKNHRRKFITDPVAPLNRDPNRDKVKDRLETNNLYIVVTSLVLADEARFKLKDATEVSAGVCVKKVGEFKLTVTYGCQGNLEQLGKQGPLFFKFTKVKFDGLHFLPDNSHVVNLSEYNLVPTRSSDRPR